MWRRAGEATDPDARHAAGGVECSFSREIQSGGKSGRASRARLRGSPERGAPIADERKLEAPLSLERHPIDPEPALVIHAIRHRRGDEEENDREGV